MSPILSFAVRVPLVLVGLAVLATGLVFISAMPDVQMVLAQVALD